MTPNATSRRPFFYATLAAALILVPSLTWYRHYKRTHFWAPINAGAYVGPLDRPASHYDPSKKPSRPWLDPKHAATAHTTYHAYPASAINGQQTDYLIYLPPGY